MPDLAAVYSKLKAILEPYAAKLDAKTDSETHLSVDTRHMQKNNDGLSGFAKTYAGQVVLQLHEGGSAAVQRARRAHTSGLRQLQRAGLRVALSRTLDQRGGGQQRRSHHSGKARGTFTT